MLSNLHPMKFIDLKTNALTSAEIHVKSDQIIIDFPDKTHEPTLWNMAYVKAFFENETLILHYEEKKQRLIIDDHNQIQSILSQYPFLKNSSRWNSKKGLLSSVLMMILLFIALLAAAYFLFLPWISEKIAKKIPMEYEQKLGDILREQTLSENTILDSTSKYVQLFSDQLDYQSKYSIQVHVIESDEINAFAIPGGAIFIYEGLLKKMDSSEELAALLGHEASHIHFKHSLQSMARNFSGQILLFFILGDQSFVLNAAHNLTALSFSRELEQEADEHALEILKSNELDPMGMIRLFEHLEDSTSSVEIPAFMSSHPLTSERKNNAFKKIKELNIKHKKNLLLEQWFQKIQSQ